MERLKDKKEVRTVGKPMKQSIMGGETGRDHSLNTDDE